MDFDLIFLSSEELRRLKTLDKSRGWLPDTPEDHELINHRLVTHERIPVDDTGKQFFHCKINENGRTYLAYINKKKRDLRSDRRHNWMIAIFTTVVGAILSRPLWQVFDWIKDWLGSIP